MTRVILLSLLQKKMTLNHQKTVYSPKPEIQQMTETRILPDLQV